MALPPPLPAHGSLHDSALHRRYPCNNARTNRHRARSILIHRRAIFKISHFTTKNATTTPLTRPCQPTRADTKLRARPLRPRFILQFTTSPQRFQSTPDLQIAAQAYWYFPSRACKSDIFLQPQRTYYLLGLGNRCNTELLEREICFV